MTAKKEIWAMDESMEEVHQTLTDEQNINVHSLFRISDETEHFEVPDKPEPKWAKAIYNR